MTPDYTVDQRIYDLNNLWSIFSEHCRVWKELKHSVAFKNISFDSDIQEMYFEGISIAEFLASHLNFQDLQKNYISLPEYVEKIKRTLIPFEKHKMLIEKVKKSEASALDPSRIEYRILRQFEDQNIHETYVENLLSDLCKQPRYLAYVTKSNTQSPLDVLTRLSKKWQGNTEFHSGLNEVNLRTHLIGALQEAGFNALAEVRNFKGHADIVISGGIGISLLIAECKFWKGGSKYAEAIDQLLGYLSPQAEQASLIIFVKNKSFDNVLLSIKTITEHHPAFGGWMETNIPSSRMEFLLSLSQNNLVLIPSSIIVFNLFDGGNHEEFV